MAKTPLGSPDSHSQRILAVDDDPVVRAVTGEALERAGYEVWQAASGAEALAILERRGLPHLALVDIRMPGMSGLELCSKLLESLDLPIIMLTSVDDVDTIVDTIEHVAEDYVLKPFEPGELVARVKRLLRRIDDFSYTLQPRVHVDDRLEIDFTRRRVFVEKEVLELTPTETKLLYVLMRAAGRILHSDYLLQRLWPMEEVFEDSLRTHVWRLRKKIEENSRRPRYVITHRGIGYSFGVKP